MSNNEALVSVVMPAYNCEKYVVEAINSILAQTYRNWELLVLDDGSKDNTLRIIEEFSQKDSRIKALPFICAHPVRPTGTSFAPYLSLSSIRSY